jgi:hypothetical protein
MKICQKSKDKVCPKSWRWMELGEMYTCTTCIHWHVEYTSNWPSSSGRTMQAWFGKNYKLVNFEATATIDNYIGMWGANPTIVSYIQFSVKIGNAWVALCVLKKVIIYYNDVWRGISVISFTPGQKIPCSKVRSFYIVMMFGSCFGSL